LKATGRHEGSSSTEGRGESIPELASSETPFQEKKRASPSSPELSDEAARFQGA